MNASRGKQYFFLEGVLHEYRSGEPKEGRAFYVRLFACYLEYILQKASANCKHSCSACFTNELRNRVIAC